MKTESKTSTNCTNIRKNANAVRPEKTYESLWAMVGRSSEKIPEGWGDCAKKSGRNQKGGRREEPTGPWGFIQTGQNRPDLVSRKTAGDGQGGKFLSES